MIEFNQAKRYNLIFTRNGHELVFTGQNVKVSDGFISFTDKYGKPLIFRLSDLIQGKEV